MGGVHEYAELWFGLWCHAVTGFPMVVEKLSMELRREWLHMIGSQQVEPGRKMTTMTSLTTVHLRNVPVFAF